MKILASRFCRPAGPALPVYEVTKYLNVKHFINELCWSLSSKLSMKHGLNREMSSCSVKNLGFNRAVKGF